ncbi:hypothetical protein SAMN05216325_11192 [Nitrosomonas marina]|uniref:Uncharacterized protein n=1 Tax=Nitrosomonas marina TaxID=917 RepID=A0A1H8F3G0_9PROT|nr:hypothetical protein SAMN05216325_11192 [Nitrosomonas marina]
MNVIAVGWGKYRRFNFEYEDREKVSNLVLAKFINQTLNCKKLNNLGKIHFLESSFLCSA